MSTMRVAAGLSLVVMLGATDVRAATPTFVCAEPGGKRLIRIDGADGRSISRESDGMRVLFITGNDILPDPHGEAILVVDAHDVRHSTAGVKLAVFDDRDIRHGTGGKVLMNYHHPDLCPTSRDNRVYSVEGQPLTKQQLVAVLYILQPGMFELTKEETAEQQKAMKEAGEEADRLAAADQVAGTWRLLNGTGPAQKINAGTIAVGPKKGAAYPVTFDHTKGGGPVWTGVGAYKEVSGEKCFWVAYGTPKTIGLCVYEIKGGSLEGTWYPWYGDGDPKNVGTETLKGPPTLDGDYQIVTAKAPATGAAYAGTVTIKPAKIVGAADNAKPYLLTWTLGTTKINGIGIRTGNVLYVSSGAGPDVNIAKFKIGNGSMNSDWFKLGSLEMGGSAATN